MPEGRKLRIGVMGRILSYHGFGVRTYLAGMLNGMLDAGIEHEVVVFLGADQAPPAQLAGRGLEFQTVSPAPTNALRRMVWDHLRIGVACRRHDIDVLFAPAHIRPLYAPCPVVVTVHDMMYHLFPEDWSRGDRFYFRLGVNLLTRRAAGIAADSRSTAEDVIRILGISEECVEVVYPGVPNGFYPRPKAEITPVLEAYGVRRPYIFYAGSFHPRKNVGALVKAFEAVSGDIPHQLVIGSEPGWDYPDVIQLIEESLARDRILLTGFIPETDLPRFYSGADLFVFPSRYEGFGFPVLEALACGCPTITTGASSLPEVAGEACVLVEPGDTSQLAEAILLVVSDDAKRAMMRGKAVEQADRFTWICAAQGMVRLLENAASAR